ncbi:MAG: arsenate reductase ArsC [candidate division FCPU426 bacterium]
MKNVLILCTGNSCRSIIAEALINQRLAPEIRAWSSGVAASGHVHPMSLKILENKGVPIEGLNSKTLDKVMRIPFDLVVTVCDNARENCPIFPGKVPVIHVGLADPVGQGIAAFEKTFDDVEHKVIPAVLEALKIA